MHKCVQGERAKTSTFYPNSGKPCTLDVRGLDTVMAILDPAAEL